MYVKIESIETRRIERLRMARSTLIQVLALVLVLFMILHPAGLRQFAQGAQTAQPHPCALNPQTDSTCQPSLLPVGTPVTANGEAGQIFGYYLEGDSGQRVYVILLDAQLNGVWVGRFVAPASVVPR